MLGEVLRPARRAVFFEIAGRGAEVHRRAVEPAGDEAGLQLLVETDADIDIVAEMVSGEIAELQLEGNVGIARVNFGMICDSTCRPKATEQATFSRPRGRAPMAETASEASSSSCRMPATRSR